MKTLGYLLFVIVAILVVLFCIGNRQIVPVFASPDFSDYGLGERLSVQAPLFLVVLLSGAIGFILGAAREFYRERKYRRVMRSRRREIGRLEHEVEALKRERGYDEDDEIIALTSR